jgi:methylase of polypeptide subunit release factors
MNPWAMTKKGVMTFWYWYVRKLNAAWPYRTVEGRRFIVLPGVYKPLENEHACAEFCRQGDRVLDLGCGCGIEAIYCAPKARSILAVDISPAAVGNTSENCKLHGVNNVEVRRSDMFADVAGKFDLILANPPYIAADFADEEEQFATSVRYLPMLFAGIDDHLADGGRLLVQYPMWYRRGLEKIASRHGMELKSVKRMPAKSLGLGLLSLAYLQVGFFSTHYLFERAAGPQAKPKGDEAGMLLAAE